MAYNKEHNSDSVFTNKDVCAVVNIEHKSVYTGVLGRQGRLPRLPVTDMCG